LNDLDLFDLTHVIESGCTELSVTCVKLNISGVPSSRWGHSASVYNDKIYILGGRNAADISDLHVFDASERNWT
jgi:hypothetical protein